MIKTYKIYIIFNIIIIYILFIYKYMDKHQNTSFKKKI